MEYIASEYKPLNDISMSNMSLREIIVAIYVRLSKEDLDSGERESESIQNQKAMLLNYAINRGWQVYNIYCDEDYSGAYATTVLNLTV